MKGSAGAILLQLQEKVGYPYTLLTPDMYRWGAGGGAGWGTLCGTVAGAANMINLLVPAADVNKLVSELFGWYSETALPTKNHESYAKFPNKTQSVAGNPLCHASVSNWCAASGYKETDQERLNRCAMLAGDVAAKAIELLNSYHANNFKPVYKVSDEVAKCQSCHVGKTSMLANTLTNMDCTPCHPNAHKK